MIRPTRRALAALLLALPLMAQAPPGGAPTQPPPAAEAPVQPALPPGAIPGQPGRSPTTAQTPRMRLVNPSAEFCVQRLGGSFEIEREPAGERGICVLRDGRRMDAWALYRAYHREAPASGGGGDDNLPPGGPHLAE